MENRGRKKFDFNKKSLVEVLKKIQKNEVTLTHYMKHQLYDAGYVEFSKVENSRRGRPTLNILLTGKARGLIGLSKNWK